MPELPEVETLRRDLDAELGGARIVAAEATGIRTLRRHGSPADFGPRVGGRTLLTVRRRGKYLLLALDGGDVIVVHMGMSGQLLAAGTGDALARHTHVVIAFEDGRELRFVDPRTFGEVFVTRCLPGAEDPPELGHLGPEPLGSAMTGRVLVRMLEHRRTRLKPLLMDQRWMVGIGNMYADEILWTARLRHDRPADRLSRRSVGRLHEAMTSVLSEAIAHRGSSLRDEQYRDLHGRIGGYQSHHRVYARHGLPCPRCATPVVRVAAYGRSNWYCPRCQR